MNLAKPTSTDPYEYEILIRRRGENDYASYCPQLNLMIAGTEHEEVRNMMKEKVDKYIESLAHNN